MLPALLPRDAKTRIGARGDRLELALQLSPGTQPVELERAVVDGGLDCAARFRYVRTVPELALQGKRLEIFERSREIAFPELKFAESGSVDHHAPSGELDELAMRDGYSTGNSLGVGLPGARRLVDDFQLCSTPGVGTTVTLKKWLR